MNRQCGTCHACCIHVAVEALEKPAGTPCTHLVPCNRGAKCGCYPTRPPECAVYTCSWLDGDGNLPENFRPDKSGILFESGFVQTVDGPLAILAGLEIKPGATIRHLERLRRCCPAGCVMSIVNHDRTDTVEIGSEADLEIWHRWMVMTGGQVTIQYADSTVGVDFSDR